MEKDADDADNNTKTQWGSVGGHTLPLEVSSRAVLQTSTNQAVQPYDCCDGAVTC